MIALRFDTEKADHVSPILLSFPFDGIQLRLNQLWPDATSPLALSFDKPPFIGTTLRFENTWGSYSSPLQLYFDGNGPVEPPTPIDNTIGIECGVIWMLPSEPEINVTLSEACQALEVAASSVWHCEFSSGVETTTNWACKPALSIERVLPWQWYSEQRVNSSFNWAFTESFATNTTIDWLVPLNQQTNNAATWLNTLSTSIHTDVIWQDGLALHINQHVRYRGQKIAEQATLKWGFPAPQWKCSSQYQAPTSPMALQFNQQFSNQRGSVILRLTASPEVCKWYPGGGLIDANPVLPPLDFKVPITPQVRRSYIMQPQLSCIRVSDGLAIVLKSVSISQSRSQWASSGSVTFSSRIDAQRAANELLKISINGYDFFMWCEMPSESKSFGVSRYSATGRGRLAELSAPYIKAANYMNSTARSFMGLMGEIMANTGWTLASEITDFNVPATAFSYAGKTPAEAINMMANAIGAMLDIDSDTKTITVIPQWPTVPWDMTDAVPDLIAHDGVILEFTEKREIRPDANAVFVRGEQQGVAVKVKRSGSAGDNFAEDVVDKIITDVQAARMRGTAELANAGNKVSTSIRTKLMADLPPMRPGMLVGVQKGTEVFKSVCDSSSITASVNGSNGAVSVNQSATLLRNEVAA
ncbi:hypothetical protein [Agarivorans gilvus]|uniref:Minor tail protein n=1 Tax=Agarivorans gilvus TaxID=680279 RepID=A0ABQ1HX45_9ALTE|nr:hypothetical protein [Agarivorans gilvus]GGA95730.1 hypothetical protein GCM10007414_05680 [Agarivorans gilvus]